MNDTGIQKRFLRFHHSAIRRFGDKQWTAADGYIEFNVSYTVSVSICEKGLLGDTGDYPYIVELSNGTKFLCHMHEYGQNIGDEILSSEGETANANVSEYSYTLAEENTQILNKKDKKYGCKK